MKRSLIVVFVIGCGGGKGGDPQQLAACTPEDQEVEGAALVFELHDLGFTGGTPAPTQLITSEAELEAALGTLPELEVDFTTDRIVLGASNPALRFVVETTTGELFVGEEPLCQGIAPSTVAYVLRDFAAGPPDALTVIACPYTGPDPCLAP